MAGTSTTSRQLYSQIERPRHRLLELSGRAGLGGRRWPPGAPAAYNAIALGPRDQSCDAYQAPGFRGLYQIDEDWRTCSSPRLTRTWSLWACSIRCPTPRSARKLPPLADRHAVRTLLQQRQVREYGVDCERPGGALEGGVHGWLPSAACQPSCRLHQLCARRVRRLLPVIATDSLPASTSFSGGSPAQVQSVTPRVPHGAKRNETSTSATRSA